jgi:DNA-binding NtrC family response regulator
MMLEKDRLRILVAAGKTMAEQVSQILPSRLACPVTVDAVYENSIFDASIRGNEYDVILAEWNLGGFQILNALNLAQSLCPNIPFIVIANQMDDDDAVALISQGAADCILSDDLERLPFYIRRILENISKFKRMHNQLKRLQAIWMSLKGSPISAAGTGHSKQYISLQQ